MYIPFLITIQYAISSNSKQVSSIQLHTIPNVFCNLLITEVFYLLSWIYLESSDEITFKSVAGFMLTYEVLYYFTHLAFHKFDTLKILHVQKHAYLDAFYAWNCHKADHIIINIMPFAISHIVFRLNSYILLLAIILNIEITIRSCKLYSYYQIHHGNQNKRYGYFYLLDRLLNTY